MTQTTISPPSGDSQMGRRLLGVRQIAEKLGVSRSTVYGLFRNNDLKWLKIGQRRLSEETDVDDYIDRQKGGKKDSNSDDSSKRQNKPDSL